jgi:predicted HicB family RNase H-like nuclease
MDAQFLKTKINEFKVEFDKERTAFRAMVLQTSDVFS